MDEITIDEQFKYLLPVLDEQTYAALEESLLENGCMHPLVVWNGILIDGHNRYEICQKHEIPFETVEKEFASRDEAIIWIITTQVGRRNLNPMQLSYFRGLHYATDKRIVTNETGANQYTKEVSRQNDDQPKNQKTVQRLADQYNVSPKTIERDAQLAEAIDAFGEVSPEAKREILSGGANISRQRLRELATGPEDELRLAAESIAEGTFDQRRAQAPKPEASGKELMEAFNAAIDKMAGEFGIAIQRLKGEIDAAELRLALRGHIDKLEDLYRQI